MIVYVDNPRESVKNYKNQKENPVRKMAAKLV